MRREWLALLAAGGLLPLRTGASAGTFRLSRSAETFFVEDDRAYARLLWFEPGGTYRQINADRSGAEEVDRGTWEQTAAGEIVLRPTNGTLTFRAVLAGPLLVMLDTQERIDSLPGLIRAIAYFLDRTQDLVFARAALAEISTGTTAQDHEMNEDRARIVLPGTQDTFSRAMLEELLGNLTVWERDKATGTAVFETVDESPAPPLLVQRGEVFSRDELARVRAANGVPRNAAPPFYFARVDRRAFLASAGNWKPFANLGGTRPQPHPAPTP